jgi:hypothetical protein
MQHAKDLVEVKSVLKQFVNVNGDLMGKCEVEVRHTDCSSRLEDILSGGNG